MSQVNESKSKRRHGERQTDEPSEESLLSFIEGLNFKVSSSLNKDIEALLNHPVKPHKLLQK